MAGEFTKSTVIRPAVVGAIANPDEYNQNIAGQSKDSVLGIDADGNFADFNVGDESKGTNGTLIKDIKIRDGYNLKIYNASGVFIRNVNLGQGTTSILGQLYINKIITVENDSGDTEHDISFSDGVFNFDDGSGQGVATAMIKQIDAAWSAGNNAGGLDTGTVQADKTYHKFAIWNPTTEVADFLFSLSETSPTMPSGYTKKKKVSALRTDGSANIRNGTWFIADGVYEFSYDSPFSVNTASVGTTRTPITMNVPAGSIARFNASGGSGSGTLTRTYFTDLDGTDITPSNANGNHIMVNSSFSSTGQFQIKSNSSGAVGARSDNASSANLYIIIEGWKEYLS